jgi:hypothetical protein
MDSLASTADCTALATACTGPVASVASEAAVQAVSMECIAFAKVMPEFDTVSC